MQCTINELKHEIFKDVYDVYEIFQNFFEEEYTDLQGPINDEFLKNEVYICTDIGNIEADNPFELSDEELSRIKVRYGNTHFDIIVWWPRVTVTNEHDKSINIQDLYAKITIDIHGKIPYEYWGFTLIRSTYDSVQFRSGYLHSHCPSFSFRSFTPRWESPCLGTGPIKGTIAELKNNNTEVTWMLFCQELSMYVTVESLTGVPYIKLEGVGVSHRLSGFSGFSVCDNLDRFFGYSDNAEVKATFYRRLKEFTLYYLEHGHFSLMYQDGVFKQGLSYFDYMMDISNAFIDWFNQTGDRNRLENLYSKGILIHAYAADGKFYDSRSTSEFDASTVEGTYILSFKGQPVNLHIEQTRESQMQGTTLLTQRIAMYILQNILKIINYRYKNEYNNRQGAESTAPTYQAVYYL